MSLLYTKDTCCGLGTTCAPLFSQSRQKDSQNPSPHDNPDPRAAAVQLCSSEPLPRLPVTVQVAPQSTNAVVSNRLRIHSRFTPAHAGNPHPPLTQIHSCYYYQDLHMQPLHTRSRTSFYRTAPPSYLTPAKAASLASSIPSIFSSIRFGRYVVTRFLADANFHGHRPTVSIKPPDSHNPRLDSLSANKVHPLSHPMLTTVCPLAHSIFAYSEFNIK